MFNEPKSAIVRNFLLLALVLLNFKSAHAAIEIRELLIRSAVNESSPSYNVDIIVDRDGRSRGSISMHKVTNVTLKRGVVNSGADDSLIVAYETQLSEQTVDGKKPLGTLIMHYKTTANHYNNAGEGDAVIFEIVDGVAHARSDPEYRYVPVRRTKSTLKADYPGNDVIDVGNSIQWHIAYDLADTDQGLLKLRIVPADDDELLIGEPSYLFNYPDYGEELLAIFPKPLPGETMSKTLIVYSNKRTQAKLIAVSVKLEF